MNKWKEKLEQEKSTFGMHLHNVIGEMGHKYQADTILISQLRTESDLEWLSIFVSQKLMHCKILICYVFILIVSMFVCRHKYLITLSSDDQGEKFNSIENLAYI